MRWLDGIIGSRDMSLSKLWELLMEGIPGLLQSTVNEFYYVQEDMWAFQVVHLVKNPSANAGLAREGSIPGLGRSPGRGNGNLLQYSCLENPIERGAWWATVH